jgi:RNA polymerase sigma-70 factor (sigma-E family)
MAGWSDAEFDAFVTARMGGLVRFAYALTGDVGHAEDLVQTALMRVYVRARRCAPDDPERYVRRVVINANVSRFRRRRVAESLVDRTPEVAAPDRPEATAEQADTLRRLLGSLPPRQRTVLALRYSADLAEAEIAALMGISAGTVKSLASRGLARLRAQVSQSERDGIERVALRPDGVERAAVARNGVARTGVARTGAAREGSVR